MNKQDILKIIEDTLEDEGDYNIFEAIDYIKIDISSNNVIDTKYLDHYFSTFNTYKVTSVDELKECVSDILKRDIINFNNDKIKSNTKISFNISNNALRETQCEIVLIEKYKGKYFTHKIEVPIDIINVINVKLRMSSIEEESICDNRPHYYQGYQLKNKDKDIELLKYYGNHFKYFNIASIDQILKDSI